MKIQIFQVDAFTGRLFGGNPAAVCPLDEWLDDGLLQNIAMENNLSETAFFVPEGDGFRLRWFTPATEVSLCGHATLAAAHVLWNHLGSTVQELRFDTPSGPVSVLRQDGRMALDFPSLPAAPYQAPSALLEGLGKPPREVLRACESPDSFNYLAVYASEDEVRSLRPDYRQLLAHVESLLNVQLAGPMALEKAAQARRKAEAQQSLQGLEHFGERIGISLPASWDPFFLDFGQWCEAARLASLHQQRDFFGQAAFQNFFQAVEALKDLTPQARGSWNEARALLGKASLNPDDWDELAQKWADLIRLH
ncbi:MAG: PhzF family phenazine biosynthesis protein [Acidobacteriota bacterium]